MKFLFLFFTQVFAQKIECITCSASYVDGDGIVDGDASCFEGIRDENLVSSSYLNSVNAKLNVFPHW